MSEPALRCHDTRKTKHCKQAVRTMSTHNGRKDAQPHVHAHTSCRQHAAAEATCSAHWRTCEPSVGAPLFRLSTAADRASAAVARALQVLGGSSCGIHTNDIKGAEPPAVGQQSIRSQSMRVRAAGVTHRPQAHAFKHTPRTVESSSAKSKQVMRLQQTLTGTNSSRTRWSTRTALSLYKSAHSASTSTSCSRDSGSSRTIQADEMAPVSSVRGINTSQ